MNYPTWIKDPELPNLWYSEEGQPASGHGEYPRGQHEPDFIVSKLTDNTWGVKYRTATGWDSGYPTAKDARESVMGSRVPTAAEVQRAQVRRIINDLSQTFPSNPETD